MTILVDGELVMYGFVGDNYWDEGFTAGDVISALAELGRDAEVTARLNSGGGYTDDGIAIYNALKAHPGKVTIHIDAIAASSASIIAMAGDEIIMRHGALMMIHDPSRFTWGDASDHEKSKEQLDKLAGLMADIYAEQCGENAEDIRAEMKEELWLTGEEAVERGFATASEGEKARAVAAFDYRVYAQAPKNLSARAKKKGWSFEAATGAANPPEKPKPQKKPKAQKKETPPMATPDDDNTMTAEAALERARAIMDSEEGQANPALAKHFAFKEPGMAVESALAALKLAGAGNGGDGGDGKPEASAGTGTDPEAYEASRRQASDLAPPGGQGGKKPEAKIDTAGIYGNRRKAAAASKGA